jgi:hypothetical protein
MKMAALWAYWLLCFASIKSIVAAFSVVSTRGNAPEENPKYPLKPCNCSLPKPSERNIQTCSDQYHKHNQMLYFLVFTLRVGTCDFKHLKTLRQHLEL